MNYIVKAASGKVEKQYNSLPKTIKRLITDKILSLETDPRPSGTLKLIGQIYRIRVGGYRIIFEIDDKVKTVIITKIAKRDERTYKGLH